MSYKIGQFKRTDLSPEAYCSSIDLDTNKYQNKLFESPYSDIDNILYDGALEYQFQANKMYIVDCAITKNGPFDYVKMKLKKNNATSDYQSVKLFNLVNKTSLQNIMGFQSYTNYDFLVLEAMRTSTTLNDTRAMFTNVKLKSLNNILDNEMFKNKKIVKIGIQGPEGLQFVVNGELMKLGKSGMYISREDMVIQSLGIALEQDNILTGNLGDGYQFFTIDYIYEEVVNNE